MIIGFQLKGVLLNYFESVDQGIISENASIIDITDYHNLSLIITTENKIYTGVPPNIKCNTSSQIINISSAATYNEDNIFIACSKEYLLSNINLETGEEESLLTYEQFYLSIISLNYSCSICTLDNITYIGISQIIDNSLINNLIKINLENQDIDKKPILIDQIIYTIDNELTILQNITYPRQISCEIIEISNNLNNSRLVCGYINFDNSTLTYKYMAIVMNPDFNGTDSEIVITQQSTLISFRLQKINQYLNQKIIYKL